MKRTLLYTFIIAIVTASGMLLSSCEKNEVYNDMPAPIQHFVAHYFPGVSVSTFTQTADNYRVKIEGGPAITFDKSDDAWVSVNGYGERLPQVLLFDQLPPHLYEYLQGIEALGNVYDIERNTEIYTVVLQDYTIIYTIADDAITGKYAPAT